MVGSVNGHNFFIALSANRMVQLMRPLDRG